MKAVNVPANFPFSHSGGDSPHSLTDVLAGTILIDKHQRGINQMAVFGRIGPRIRLNPP